MNDALKQAGKWGGIIIGLGVVLYAILQLGVPGLNQVAVRDTVEVVVQGLPDTVFVERTKLVPRPYPVQDTTKIAQMLLSFHAYDSLLAKQDSMLTELLVEREAEIFLEHRDTNFILVGKIPVVYSPITKDFDAMLVIDTLSAKTVHIHPPSGGLDTIQILSGAIAGFFIALLLGG